MRSHRSAVSFLLLALVFAISFPLIAQGRRSARLVFDLDPGLSACPGESDLRDGVAMRLGYDPFLPDAEREVRVVLKKIRNEASAHVELRSASGSVLGTRDLRSSAATCGDLTAAITLAISLAIDPARAMNPLPAASASATPPPGASAAPSGSSPAPPASSGLVPVAPPASSSPEPPASSAPAVVAPRSSDPVPWTVMVGGGGGVALGAGAAALSPEIRAGLGLRRGALWFGADGYLVRPSRVAVSGGRIETSQLGIELRPCMVRGVMLLCGSLTVGGLRGAALDIDRPDQQTTFFATAGARAGVQVPLGRGVRLIPLAGLDATLTRTRLNFRGTGVWETGLLGGVLHASVSMDL